MMNLAQELKKDYGSSLAQELKKDYGSSLANELRKDFGIKIDQKPQEGKYWPAFKETIAEATQKRLKAIKEYPKKRKEYFERHPLAPPPTLGMPLTGLEYPKEIPPSPLPIEQYTFMRLAKESGVPIASEKELQAFKETYKVEASDTPLKIAGKATSLLGMGGAAQALGLTGYAAGAMTWGGSQALEETSKLLVKDEQLSWKQPARIAKETAYGTALQGIHQIRNIPTRVFTGGLARSTWTTLGELIEKKKITQQSIVDGLISFGLGSFIEGAHILLNAPNFKLKNIEAKAKAPLSQADRALFPQFTEAWKANDFNRMESVISQVKSEGMRGTMLDLLQRTRAMDVLKTDPAIQKVSTALVTKQLPIDIHALPPAIQQTFGTKLIDTLSSSTKISLPEAADKAFQSVIEAQKPPKIEPKPSTPTVLSYEPSQAIKIEKPSTVSGEEGFIEIPNMEEFQKGISRLTAIFDIEKPFVDIEAPKTGFTVKNYFSRRETEREKGLEVIKNLTKTNLTPEEYIETTFIAAQPTLFAKYTPEQKKRFSPAYQIARNFFDSHIKKLQKYKVIADPWPRSLIKKLQEENIHSKESLTKTKNVHKIQKIKNSIENNKTIIEFLKAHKIQYVHLPLRIWFEDIFTKQPENAPRILSRFFKERETIDLRELARTLLKSKVIEPNVIQNLLDKNLITPEKAQEILKNKIISVDNIQKLSPEAAKILLKQKSVIEPKDVDIRNIIAAYSDKIGKTYALSEIFQNAKKEGLVKSIEDAPTDWVSPPSRLVPEFKGRKVHPAFMNYLENFIKTTGPAYKISRPLGYIKILAFDNPLFLGGYNIEQGIWAGSFRTLKTPKHFYKASKSIQKKDDDYWNAVEYGLFSKPYIPPFEDFTKEVELASEISFIKRGFKWLNQNFSGKAGFIKGPLDTVYKPLWNIAWNYSDKYPRMTTYHYLLDKGFSAHEAAQLGAYFHGDYASIPPATRKTVNKIFFTPTFKIAMSKLYLSMGKSIGKVLINAAQMKSSSKRDKLLAGGLIALLGIEYGRRKFMQAYGFKEEHLGLRFKKEVETDKGKRELVLYWPSASNTWLRYYHRWKSLPSDPNKLEGFINRAKWDLHPLWRSSIMWLQNRQANGQPIYNPFDNKIDIVSDSFDWWTRDIVSILDKFPDEKEELDRERRAYKALKNDLKQMYPLFQIFTPTKLAYLRKPEDVRKYYRIKALKKEFEKFMYRDMPKTFEERQKRINNLNKKIKTIQNMQ